MSALTNLRALDTNCLQCMIMVFQQWNGINAINYYA